MSKHRRHRPERYGLQIVGATCVDCGRHHVMRQVWEPIPLTWDHCTGCGGPMPWVYLRWHTYDRWMTEQATYIEYQRLP